MRIDSPITKHAYAKINLILRVYPPTTAGMHPICSWMHPIDLHDTITITPRSHNASSTYDIRWNNDTPVEWDLESDLIVKAHRALEQHADQSFPSHIEVRKSIPDGGGLGGGSSNAATVLQILNTRLDQPLNEIQLASIAHTIGSDIPFFIDQESFELNHPPRSALVTNLGDQITRTHQSASHITLFLPPFGCPTPKVYHTFDQLDHADLPPIDPISIQETIDDGIIAHHLLRNDLQIPATIVQPPLQDLINDLDELDIVAHVSGSGSTLFTIDPLTKDQRAAFEHAHPDVRIIETELS